MDYEILAELTGRSLPYFLNFTPKEVNFSKLKFVRPPDTGPLTAEKKIEHSTDFILDVYPRLFSTSALYHRL